MNSVHDLGGMDGFGPVEREEDEPAFHADWERIIRAMSAATRAQKLYNLDEFRHSIERMNPAYYLGSSYYEHWLDGMCRLLTEKGVIDAAELDRRGDFFLEHPDAPARAAMSGPPAPSQPFVDRSSYSEVAPVSEPRFSPGDAIVTRNINPTGHTRLPRYARGKRGVIERMHGTYVFPDSHAHGKGEQPQPVYNVRFDGVELWGERAEPGQMVFLDCWESYLLPA
ncbi:MAG: nitrile hydratase subunit beta [Dehalococcoidia bacterium]